jgi:hypothetical protein
MQHNTNFPIIQYADDTLIIMEGCARQLVFIKSPLHTFAPAIGLKANYAKSMMVPINLESEKVQVLAQAFGCAFGSMPFTYLGVPLGTTKPSVEDFLPLVNKCDRRLANTSIFQSQAGRLL